MPSKWRTSLLFMFLMMLSGSILASQLTTLSASPATTVSVNPVEIADKTMGPGSTFSINVTVADVTDLWGYQVVVFYNTTVLNATDFMSYAPFTDESPSSINRTAGFVTVTYSMEMGTPVGGGVTTNASVPSVNLVKIDFTVINYGTTLLELNTVKLADPAAGVITVTTKTSGSFSNIDVHNIAIREVEVSPTRVEAPGGVFTFNVSLGNLGDFPETFNVSTSFDGLVSINQTDLFLAIGDNMTLSFTWDTTGQAIGEYTATTKAILALDNYPVDNTFSTKIRIGVKRDVAVMNVTASTQQATPGESVIIYVTVKNLGDFSETFPVVATYRHDSTETVLGTQSASSLTPGFSTTVAFNWATGNLALGDYQTFGEAVAGMDDDLSNNVMQGDTVSFGGSAGSEIFIYGVIAIVAIVVVVVVVRYVLRRRKPKK